MSAEDIKITRVMPREYYQVTNLSTQKLLLFFFKFEKA